MARVIGLILCWAALIAGCRTNLGDETNSATSHQSQPNILLIVADDLGYTDLGSFGGEIETPTLDALARSGLRLSNFHAAPSCAPTRAMLMTGTDNHIAGMGSQSGLETPKQSASDAYRNALLPSVPTIAERLADVGYRTLAVAKWHLGSEPEEAPKRRGFARSFVLLEGGAGHFDDTPLFESYEQGHWLEDDVPTSLPESFYSTDYMTDKLLAYIAEGDPAQPFFAYLGYTAPHWPLQAPAEDIARYHGRYDAGWDDLRAKRMQGAIREGVVEASAQAVDFEAGMLPWSELSDPDKATASRRMETYAAMVHRLDANVGRVLLALRESGELAHTVIVFISDNGAEAHPMDEYANIDDWVVDNFDNSLLSIGSRHSYTSLGPSWARATAAPYRASKSKISEGGIRVPAFIALPGGTSGIDDSYMRVMDLAPTFLELAGAGAPTEMMGRSLLSRLNGGASAYGPDEAVAFETYGRRGVQRGDWKLLLQEAPYGTGQWQLYNTRVDQGEQIDLAAENPDIVNELSRAYDRYAQDVGVIAPEQPIAY